MSKGNSGRSGVPSVGEIYQVQEYIDPSIVSEKRENKDYDVQVAHIKDGRKKVWIVVDGNYSLRAAILDKKKPNIKIVRSEHKDLESFVSAFGELDNPTNVMTGETLW